MATSRKSPIQRQDRSPAAVKVEGLSKSYGSQEVLHDVSFNVEPGEIFVIMGPSGSGKSVLLRHIAGLEVPTRGKLDINVGKGHIASYGQIAPDIAANFKPG